MATDLVRPDAIYNREGEEFNALDPCPACDSRPHDAPEGVRSDGKPHWSFEHCWKCGYRPGTNVAVSQSQMRKQWEDFQAFLQEKTQQDFSHPTLQAPADSQVEELRAQLAAAQAQLAERNTPDSGIGTNTAFGGSEG